MKFDALKQNGMYIFFIFLISGIIYCLLKYYLINLNLPVTGERLGQFGDYIGGLLNPILTFFSFLALLFTITIQNKQLSVSTRELSTASETLKENQKVMGEQLLTQSLQQFDSIFFAMLKELNSLLYELERKNASGVSHLDISHEIFNENNHFTIEDLKKEILSDRLVSRYFILLYQLLKLINTRLTNNNYINNTEKHNLIKMYSNIVRSSISEKAMHLLIINALNEDFKPFKELIEKFRFFEHTSFKVNDSYILNLIHAAQEYKSLAFDQSLYFKELINDHLFGNYIIKHNIKFRPDLLHKIFIKINSSNPLQGPFRYSSLQDDCLFCNVRTNSRGYPLGILIDSNKYLPISFGTFSENKFSPYRGYETLKFSEKNNQIDIKVFNNDEDFISVIFVADKNEFKIDISDKIKNM